MRTTRLLQDRESGQLTLFLVILIPALLAIVAIGIDGAGAVAAQTKAYSTAQAAARAGANTLAAGEAINSGAGNVGYDAPAIAEGYLAASGFSGSASRTAQTVTVTADTWYETKLLSIVGITAIPVHATARAELVSE